MLNNIASIEELIRIIEKEKLVCYFISPHLDDAAFSAGGLITYLSKTTKVVVVNVFTKSEIERMSYSAKAFLKQCRYSEARSLFEDRKLEDNTALSKYGVQIINLDFTDALWRKKKYLNYFENIVSRYIPEFGNLYPTYRYNIISGKIHKEDYSLIEELSSILKKIVKNNKFLIFSPIGFGNHIDHIVTREACLKAFDNVYFWSDFPYGSKITKNKLLEENYFQLFAFDKSIDEKVKLCLDYKSQFTPVIRDKNRLYVPEIYYTKKYSNTDGLVINVKDDADNTTLNEWQKLWESSCNRNYFNSPIWFKSCIETFNYSSNLILTCYENKKLVGVMPLVYSKSIGIPAYKFLGGNYLDKCNILIQNNDTRILKALIEQALNLKNIYLEELNQLMYEIILNFNFDLNTANSSKGLYLNLFPNPFRYLNHRHQKQIRKILEMEGNNFNIQIIHNNINKYLKTIVDIEKESAKGKSFREVFSNVLLRRLILNLHKHSSSSIQIIFLYYKNIPICYQFGFITDHTYHFFQTSYKENYQDLIPGKILLYLVMPELQKKGIDIIDFTRGETRFKKDFTPFIYSQFVVFKSNNKLIDLWWNFALFIYNYLNNHSTLFELARLTLNKFRRDKSLLLRIWLTLKKDYSLVFKITKGEI